MSCWRRLLIFLAAGAVLANARCLETCIVRPVPAPTKQEAPKCPLHKDTPEQTPDCEHQQPQLATAEPLKAFEVKALEDGAVAAAPVVIRYVVTLEECVLFAEQVRESADYSRPPLISRRI